MIDLTEYGYDPVFFGVPGANEIAARVTSVQRERYGIICAQGESFARRKASAFHADPSTLFPTVGDFVCLRWNSSGDSLITRTMPRRSFFARADSFSPRGVQAIAANIDYALLVSSLNRDFNLRRLERYFAQTIESGAQPVFVLTKADLCPDPEQYMRQVRSIAPDAPILAVSAHSGHGMEALGPFLAPGKTLVLLGMSGVGKSSLLNALMGFERMKVNRTRDVDSSKGRHTTTHRELIQLPIGALVIDTPGMRELSTGAAADFLSAQLAPHSRIRSARDGVAEAFADIEALAGQCRFSDCRHESEPGCAVRAASARGNIDPRRLKNYLHLQQNARRMTDIAARRGRK